MTPSPTSIYYVGPPCARYGHYGLRYAKNGVCVECCRKHTRLYVENNPKFRMLSGARKRAKKFKIPCTITMADIIIPEVCPILGIPLKHHKGRPEIDSPSLDRIIPEKGYVPGNIAVISYRANRFKNNLTLEQVIALLKHISPGALEYSSG